MPTCKKRFVIQAIALAGALIFCSSATAAENLIGGGDFETGLSDWRDFWSRTPGGKAFLDPDNPHGGRNSLRVEHTGSEDWSVQQQKRIDVAPRQIYELEGWLRVKGEGTTSLSVILYGEKDKVLDWSFGGQTIGATDDWRPVRSRFIVPEGATAIVARLIGNGPATVWLDDARLALAGSLEEMRAKNLPEKLTASSPALEVTLRAADATLDVTDRRSGRVWKQQASSPLVVLDARPADAGFDLRLLEPASMLQVEAAIRLDAKKPELLVELSAVGEEGSGLPAETKMTSNFHFPPPFVTSPGELLILPVNEGISYPVDDPALGPMSYYLYGGHGLCMGWWGMTDGDASVMAVVETPDDARVRIPKIDGLLRLEPEWEPQKGRFGPPRRIRYVFFDAGGYVAMCKRYREYSQQIGLFKTLAQKREEIPAVDRLVGAVNVWCWDRDPVGICRELQEAGIERILWSNRSQPEQLDRMNAMGVLTSRYDIYQDAMDPANFPKLRGVHGDWTSDAWPQDLMLDARGDWIRGWRVLGKDGEWYPCGVLCDRQAVEYARRRIPPELETHPYLCRFIDTTTASSWRECYSPEHPVTRSESRHWKMQLLRYMSEECDLVTGSETGHEAAVPYVHYFEGMLSLGPYRVPDAGRNMAEVLDEVPERVAKFQTGHYYRLPLWELVYHDCVVAQWYWGDYNNKLPSLWDRRDLFNALYGTPPMFMFRRDYWREHRDRFVQSYNTAATIACATGYHEMLSHRWLTDDHAVQESRFANGVVVTVNFGDKPYTLADGTALGPLAHRFEGVRTF
jgi:hypothetical protein